MPLSDRDKRTLKIGGIIAGILLLAVLAMNVIGGGDEDLASPPVDRPDPTETDTPPPSTEPTVPPPAPPAFTGRDPFSIPPGFSTSGSTSSSTSSGSTTSTSTSSGTGSGSGSTSQPTQPGNGSSATVGGRQVTLLDVFTSGGSGAAQVEIGGQVYNVTVGETFGPGDNYELRSTSGNCATFLYGDESFTLCTTPEK